MTDYKTAEYYAANSPPIRYRPPRLSDRMFNAAVRTMRRCLYGPDPDSGRVPAMHSTGARADQWTVRISGVASIGRGNSEEEAARDAVAALHNRVVRGLLERPDAVYTEDERVVVVRSLGRW